MAGKKGGGGGDRKWLFRAGLSRLNGLKQETMTRVGGKGKEKKSLHLRLHHEGEIFLFAFYDRIRRIFLSDWETREWSAVRTAVYVPPTSSNVWQLKMRRGGGGRKNIKSYMRDYSSFKEPHNYRIGKNGEERGAFQMKLKEE